MPTSNYDAFERWIDSVLFGTNVTYNHKTNTMTVKNPVSPFEIQSVLSNRKKNAFTVVWADGTHTTVHCQPGDEWDDEKALAMCFTKKALGNKGNFNDKFNDALDNKMKVIPGGAGIIAEKECDCNSTCEVCECKMTVASVGENRNGSCLTEEAIANASTEEVVFKKPTNAFGLNKETADELTKATIKANKSLKEMINALTGETEKPEVKEYKVFVKANGTITPAGTYHDAKSTTARVKELAAEHFGRKPYYYRCWMEGDKMVIDFGSYSKFIVIQGMTPNEWFKD